MINTPQEEVTLPDEVRKHIERARNNITIMEAERERLNGLASSQQYAITEAHKELSELDAKVAKAKEESLKLESERLLLINEVEELLIRKESYDKEYAVRENTIQDAEAVIEARTKELEHRAEEIEAARKDIKDKMTDLHEREAILTVKEGKIKQIVALL